MTYETVKLDNTVDYGQHDQSRRIPSTAMASTFKTGGFIPGPKPAHVSVSLEFIRGARAALAHFVHTAGPSDFDAIIAAEVLRQMPKEADK